MLELLDRFSIIFICSLYQRVKRSFSPPFGDISLTLISQLIYLFFILPIMYLISRRFFLILWFVPFYNNLYFLYGCHVFLNISVNCRDVLQFIFFTALFVSLGVSYQQKYIFSTAYNLTDTAPSTLREESKESLPLGTGDVLLERDRK